MNSLRLAGLAALGCIAAVAGPANTASAAPSLVVDIATGSVLEQVDATQPWYPASLTKLLTVYVALSAVRDGRVSMDTPFVVSARADSMPPSKMGFTPGTEVTLNNALKMLLVKSANDLAITIAEGISGSVEDFATEMNSTAAKLGMHDSHFMNPNGLPDPNHYTSARDIAIVALALFRDFPQEASLWDIGAFRLGDRVIPNHNNLLGRYPGVDGMKTGYTCASGSNIVVSDTRGGRHLLVVVLGAPNIKIRTAKATALLDAAYEGVFPNGPQLSQLPASTSTRPPDLHAEVCGRHRKIVAENDLPPPLNSGPVQPAPGGLPPMAVEAQLAPRPHFDPIPVFLGPKPGWTGPVAEARGLPTPVSAYASDKVNAGPLAPDPQALPLNVSARTKTPDAHVARAKHWRRRRRHAARAASPAPATADSAPSSPAQGGTDRPARKRHARRTAKSPNKVAGATTASPSARRVGAESPDTKAAGESKARSSVE